MADTTAALVLAAGRGERMGGAIPKQYLDLGGVDALGACVRLFVAHPAIDLVQIVVHPDDRERYERTVAGFGLPEPVAGGASRQASVHCGLNALAAQAPGLVLIHDAARPFADAALVDRAVTAGRASGAAIPVLPVTDTVKSVDADNRVTGTLDRASLRIVQTPQAFRFAPLLQAHRQAAAAGRQDFTDDAALAEWAGMTVTTFAGDARNMKLTAADDIVRARSTLAMQGDIRTGTGFDVHAFAPGDHVMLGGVRIAHARGLAGHSDADVVLHAAVDAILGAIGDGDIGQHFPPSDPQWKGISSDRFLAFAVERLAAHGGRLGNLDITVICEAPKIGPHREAMRARIAAIAGIDIGRVGVKATTSEGLGFTGRGEGIAAMATATVRIGGADAAGR